MTHVLGRLEVSVVTVLALLALTASARAAERFERLSSAQIRNAVAGHVMTDDAHWSDRFERDGRLQALELGKPKAGIWRTSGNELCMIRNPRKEEEECFEVWRSGNEVELRRDGVTVISAFLRRK